MTIDVWAQITTGRMASAPWLSTLNRWTGNTGVPTPQSTLAVMDAAGVEIALLSAWFGPEGPLVSNEEVSAQIDAAPERFRGLASAAMISPSKALEGLQSLNLTAEGCDAFLSGNARRVFKL